MAVSTLSAKELALELGADARTTRKFLRDVTDPENHPGQGGRWGFTKGQVKGLKKKFAEWSESKAQRNSNAADEEVEDIDDIELDEDDVEEI